MKRLLLASIVCLAAWPLLAQMPPAKWWRRPEIIRSLNLSDDQQRRLDEIFRATASDLIDRRAEVEKRNLELRGELDQPELNRAAIQRSAARLTESRGRLFDRELGMLVDMRAVLTEPQWNRMRSELDLLGGRNARADRRQNRPVP